MRARAPDSSELLSREALNARFRAIGAAGYHDKHPFHRRMHEGTLTRRQLQAWIENRFYYQAMIPRKDATILARTLDPELRRAWIHRITDHDGAAAGQGGLERWLVLAEAAGLARADVASFRFVLPGVRFAVDAYLDLVRERTLLEAVASSLTELFAPGIMAVRLPAFAEHYPWIDARGLEYFRARLVEAPRDVEHGLEWVLAHATTRALQEAAIAALEAKCQILWSLLDAIHFGYVEPGVLPPFFPDRLPAEPGGLPAEPGGLPAEPGGLPAEPGGLPAEPGGLPAEPGGPTGAGAP